MRALVSRFVKAASYFRCSSTELTPRLAKITPYLRPFSTGLSPRYYSPLSRVTTPHSLLPLRQLPTSGFVTLDPNEEIEEEQLDEYEAMNYYPVCLGEIFKSKYQVVSKLGYSETSTTWLCRDLIHGFKVLKVFVLTEDVCWDFTEEVEVAQHLQGIQRRIGHSHPHENYLSSLDLAEESFKILGPSGNHTCLVF
ncbi:hypothetical protein N7478_007637 [Penicillium angulare]|uniref:uncharacterized protein n=1 Tax=Penicillium angulare TaxID=116970 RepID=UPI0025421C8E|nr:uncharacterized protein N7478_007637 [Penicillium angulare]KAJ5272512.1 hypothetical protein N7478_007637 [Penicillium angulare]